MFYEMSVTHIFSFVFGLYFISVGIGLFLERNQFQALMTQFSENAALSYLGGIVAFSIGAAIITLHQDWSSPLAILISALGWFILIKGMILLAFSKAMTRVMACKCFTSRLTAMAGIIFILIGLWMFFAATGA